MNENMNLQDWERELLAAPVTDDIRDVTADESASLSDANAAEYATTIHGWPVTVDKIGGGTRGRAYEGDWTVTVMNGPVYVVDNGILSTGTPKTHTQVARLAYEFASEREEI